jgi:sugar phosphate isomerase/epimerase
MERRTFLTGSIAAVGAAARVWGQRAGAGATTAPSATAAAKTDRIAIMAYSFVRILKVPGQAPSPERTLEVFDLPQMFADRYRVHNVEMQHNYFESTETSFLKTFVAQLAKTKSRVTNINLELGNMSISAATPALRAQAVDLTRAWIDHAIVLGSPRVMINQGKLTPENKAAAIETLQHMTAYAKTKNIMVGAEPRDDDFTLLTEVLRAGGAYTNPDVGNFGGDQAHQHEGMRAMFPYTDGNCHMKILNPPKYDLPTAVRLTKELGYKGLYSIENELPGDPYKNVQDVYDVLIAEI